MALHEVFHSGSAGEREDHIRDKPGRVDFLDHASEEIPVRPAQYRGATVAVAK